MTLALSILQRPPTGDIRPPLGRSRRWSIRARIGTLVLALFLGIVGQQETDGGETPPGASAAPVASAESNIAGVLSGRAFPSHDEVLRFRYWMVPADHIDGWPWGSEKYYPVAAPIFSRWIAEFEQKEGARRDNLTTAGLAELRLSARMEGDALIDGAGTARFTGSGGGEHPFLLEPCSLSLSSLRWGDQTDASVGLYPDGHLYVAHPKNQLLSFRWSLAGTRTASGERLFDVAYVPSPATELLLDLPPELRPRVSHGVVGSPIPGLGGERRWPIYPGSTRMFRLIVSPTDSATPKKDKTGFRQEISYRVAPEGVDIVARWTFDRSENRLDVGTVILDQPLMATAVEWSNGLSKAEWIPQLQSLGTTKLQVRIPEPVGEEIPELTVRAFCPWRGEAPGSGDFPWRLPGLRLLSDGAVWKSTLVRLEVVRPMLATGFGMIDAAQTADRFAEYAPNLSRFAFKFFEPNGAVTVRLTEMRPQGKFRSATVVSLDPQEIGATATLLLETDSAGLMKIPLAINKNWEIESVKEGTTDALGWSTEKKPDGTTQLNLSLKRPLPPREPLRLELTGRWIGDILPRMKLDDLVPFDLREVLHGPQLVTFRSAFPYRVELTNADGNRVEPVPVAESVVRELFDPLPATPVLELGAATPGWHVRVEKTSPACSGTLDGQFILTDGTLRETWRIETVPPVGGRVDRVVVAMVGADEQNPTEWNWSITSESDRTFQAVELGRAECAAMGLPGGTRAWEIRLSTSRSLPFEIVASRNRSWDDEISPTLAILPEAASQQARCRVESNEAVPFTLIPLRMRSVPIEPAFDGEFSQTVGTFRYNPEEFLHTTFTPQLTIRREDTDARSTAPPQNGNAWCSFLRLDTQYESSGTVRNHLTCYLKNAGRNDFTLSFPESPHETTLHAVWIDNERVPWYPEQDETGERVRIPLNDRKAFVTVSLEYHGKGEPLSRLHHRVPHLPTLNFPVLSGTWVAWFPPEYTGYSSRQIPIFTPITGQFRPGSILPDPKEIWNAIIAEWPSRHRRDTMECRRRADTFLDALGNPESLATLGVADPLDNESLDSSRSGGGLTWGRIFADPKISTQIFPPEEGGDLHIFINREALGRIRVLPTHEYIPSTAATYAGRTIGALEKTGLVLLFLNSNTLYVTSISDAHQYRDGFVSLGNDRIWLVERYDRAAALAATLVGGSGTEVVTATDWGTSPTLRINPWRRNSHAGGFTFVTPGWNTCRASLDEASNGIYVVSRYRLAAVKWILFLLVVTLTWRGPLAHRGVLIGLIGFTPATFAFVPPLFTPALGGVMLGALVGLIFHWARSRPLLPQPQKIESHPSINFGPSGIPHPELSSEPGFVGPPFIPLELPPPKESPAPPKENGAVSVVALIALTLALAVGWILGMFWVAPVSGGIVPSTGQESGDEGTADASEPFRVFVPYGPDLRPRNDDYLWLPEPFHRQLLDLIRSQENLENPWRITRAVYEGVVNHNGFTQTLSLFHLKATYTVEMETPLAKIRLPMMPLPPDGGAKFDRQPIDPIFQSDELIFEVNQTTPGRHTLELILTPPPPDGLDAAVLRLTIPRIPDARLELVLPPESPAIRVEGGFGATGQTGNRLTARLGATDQIVLEKIQDPSRIGGATVEVEQLFAIRARPYQTSVSARYRYRISGGRVSTLALENDPRYRLLRCTCDEAPIEPLSANETTAGTTKIVFKKPVTGTVTLRAEYALTNFSGIGQIRLPHLRAAHVRVTRSWLALFESQGVELTKLPPPDIAAGTFKNLWEGNETPIAVYDLLRPDTGWSVSIRLRPVGKTVREETAFLFEPEQTRIDYSARFQSTGEVFQAVFRTPAPFEVESVVIRDAVGNRIDPPESYSENGRFFLFFRAPLSGEYLIRIQGRMKSVLDQSAPFPVLTMEDAAVRSARVDVYYARSVCLDLDLPKDWTNETVGSTLRAEFLGDTARFAASYSVPTTDLLQRAQVSVRLNLPKISGSSQAIFFSRQNDRWEILTDWSLNITDGELDRFEIELDEPGTTPILIEPDLPYRMEERGKKNLLVITPQSPVTGRFHFRVRMPVQRLSETLRLPRLRLLGPDDEPERLSQTIFLPAFDQIRKTSLRWDSENLRPLGASKIPPPPTPLISEEKTATPSEPPSNLSSESMAESTAEVTADGETETENHSTNDATPESQGPSPAVAALLDAASGNASDRNRPRKEEFPALVSQLSGMTKDDFHPFEVTGENYHAALAPGREAMQVFFAESSFFFRADGSFYGESLLDVRLGEEEAAVLILPPNAKPLKITIDGITVPSVEMGGNRFRIVFLPESQERVIAVEFLADHPPAEIVRLGRAEYQHLNIAPVRIESVPTIRNHWTVVFESQEPPPRNIPPYRVKISEATPDRHDSATESAATQPETPESLTFTTARSPLPILDAEPIVARFALEQMKHRLDLLELSANRFSPNDPDYRNWLAAWSPRWNRPRRIVENRLTAEKNPPSAKIDTDPTESLIDFSDDPNATPLGPVTESGYRELLARYEKILATTASTETVSERNGTPNGSHHGGFLQSGSLDSFDRWRMTHSEVGSTALFGLSNRDVGRIELWRPISPRRPSWLWSASITWFLGTVLVLFLTQSESFRRGFFRFFPPLGGLAGIGWSLIAGNFVVWSVTAGLLIWSIVAYRSRQIPTLPSPTFSENSQD